jgi:hypothetical protein
MTYASRIFATVVAVLATAGLAVPLGALAEEGGTQYGAAASGGMAYGTPTGEVGGPALRAKPSSLLGRTLHFRGTASPGAQVAVQRLDAGSGWTTVARATAGPDGAYLARWRTDHIGVFSIRAVPADAAQVAAAGSPESITVTVFKPALATWYGPGFYGKRTACGVRLTRSLVGVAHRGLPCGRKVAIFYKGRTIIAPVVDRGPFAHGADWDLTAAAAEQLGFETTDEIGAVSLRPAAQR